MPSQDRVRALATKLPIVRDWIDKTVARYQKRAIPIADLNLPRLSSYFSPKLLRQAKAILFPDILPFPPFDEIGLSEFSPSKDKATYEAITYKDTIFLQESFQSETLYFHELVHVIQWRRLGKNRFLLAYIAGLLEFGYRHCPLEEMAFSLQERFRHGDLPANLTEGIHKRTDAIWQNTAKAYSLA